MPLRALYNLVNMYNASVDNVTDESRESEEDEEMEVQQVFVPEVDILPIVLAIMIITVNLWVIYAVYRKRFLRTVANYFLASLALSDLLTGLVSVPTYLACSIMRELAICTVSHTFLRFTSISTVAHLFCVTMDRYVSIMFSLRYCTLVTKKRGFLTIGTTWAISLFIALIQLSWFNSDEDVEEDSSVENQNHDLRFDVFLIVVFFTIPLLAMMYVYARILAEVRRQNHMIQKYSTPGWKDKRKNNLKERRAVITFALMALCYVVGWLPYFTLRIQHHFDVIPNLPHWVEYLLIYMRYATSFANPLLYILGKQDFRKALPRLRRDRTDTSTSISRTENFRLSEAKSTTT